MPEVRIRIGAAVDQSMRTVFKPLVQAAIEARKAVQKEFASLGSGMKGSFTDGGRTARKVFADTSKASEDMSRDLERQATKRARLAEQESKREWSSYIRSMKSAFAETQKEAAKNERALNRFAERTSHRVTRFFMPHMPIMSMASRAGHEVLQGMGVEASIAGLVRRGVGIEQGAANLSNRGHIEGAEGANGKVVDPKALEAEARRVGAATAVNPEEILAAGREFVGLTGDLDLWRKIMPGVVAQTKALGGNQEQAAAAAGEFAAHIGEVPDKVKAVLALTHIAAGQGKIGGVDFSDFAKYAAKVAAPAALFKGDKTQNISKLTAMAEIAKMHGGASSAAMAFGSIDSLVNTLKKPARFKSVKALLGNENGQFSDSSHSELMDPHELAKQLIVASSKDKDGKSGKSDIGRVAAALGDARSLKAVTGLQVTFNEAGGGQAGLDAMNAELKKFSGAIMSTEEISRGLTAALNTTESKAERFNQKLENITHGAMATLLPALEKLEEPALKVATYLGELATVIANDPGKAILDAIGIVILRAGIESAFRHGIETVLKNAGTVSTATQIKNGGALAQVGGLVGLFTSAAVIAALAAAIEEAGEVAIDHFFKNDADKQRKDSIETANSGAALANATVHARKGSITVEDRDALEKGLEFNKKKLEAAQFQTDNDDAVDPMTGARSSNEERKDSRQITELKAEIAKMSALIDAMKNGTLKVTVVNLPPPPMPAAPVAGGGPDNK